MLELVTSQDAGVTAQLFVESGLLPVIAVLMADTKTTKTKGFFSALSGCHDVARACAGSNTRRSIRVP